MTFPRRRWDPFHLRYFFFFDDTVVPTKMSFASPPIAIEGENVGEITYRKKCSLFSPTVSRVKPSVVATSAYGPLGKHIQRA